MKPLGALAISRPPSPFSITLGPPPQMTEEQAAVKIQAIQRGRQDRKKVEELKAAKEGEAAAEEPAPAAEEPAPAAEEAAAPEEAPAE